MASLFGLLGDESSLAPSINNPVLARLGGGSATQAALQQRVMSPAAAVPGAQQGQQPRITPGVAPAPVPPPRPIMSPLQSGLLAGGLTALENSGPSANASTGQIIARALAAGVPSYVAGKQQERASATNMAEQQRFQDMLNDPALDLDPATKKLVQGMSAANGLKYLEDYMKQKNDTVVATPEQRVVTKGGKTVSEGGKQTFTVDGVLYERQDDGTLKSMTDRKPQDLTGDMVEAADTLGFGRDPKAWNDVQRNAIHQRVLGLKKAGTITTNVNVNPERAFFAGLGEQGTAEFAAARTAANGARDALSNVRQAATLLGQEKTFVGPGGNIALGASRALKTLGIDWKEGERVNTETLRAVMKQNVIAQLQKMGRQPTDEDLRQLELATGNITSSPESLKGIFAFIEGQAGSSITDYNTKLDAAKMQVEKEGGMWPATLTPVKAAEAPSGEGESSKDVTIEGQKYKAKMENGKWTVTIAGKKYNLPGAP